MLLALVATFGYALYNLATRYLAGFDPPEVTQTYTPLGGVLILAPFALAAWHWPTSALQYALLASLGFWGGLGHWLLILAHRSAPAPVLAPFIYLGLLWMSVAGYLIFGNVPTLWTLSGAAVVILSGLYLLRPGAESGGRGQERSRPRTSPRNNFPPSCNLPRRAVLLCLDLRAGRRAFNASQAQGSDLGELRRLRLCRRGACRHADGDACRNADGKSRGFRLPPPPPSPCSSPWRCGPKRPEASR